MNTEHKINLIVSLYHWTQNATVDGLMSFYDSTDRHYCEEKLKKLFKNPLEWFCSLDFGRRECLVHELGGNAL